MVRAQSTPAAVSPAGTNPAPKEVLAPISVAAAEILKLVRSGVGDEIILPFIQNHRTRYNLTADEVLSLGKSGVKPNVITAMLQHDHELALSNPGTTTPTGPPGPATASDPVPMESQIPVVAPSPSSPPVEVSNPPMEVGYFYADLVPYGAWARFPDLGWCWQPRVATMDREWRPYCQSGHWVETDSGWFWQSDYIWGWAPFHYGRWKFQDTCGWVWQPDTVWAPAWVTWRADGARWGWAPLPPQASFDPKDGYHFKGTVVGANCDFGLRPEEFTFIELKHFLDRDLGRRKLPPQEVVNSFTRAEVINNLAHEQGWMVNHGVASKEVASATGVEIKHLEIREIPAGSKPVNTGRTESQVFRPRLLAAPRTTGMFAQKIDDKHPTILQFSVPGKTNAVNTNTSSTPPPARVPPPQAFQRTEPSQNFGQLARPNENRPDTLAPYFPPPMKVPQKGPTLPNILPPPTLMQTNVVRR